MVIVFDWLHKFTFTSSISKEALAQKVKKTTKEHKFIFWYHTCINKRFLTKIFDRIVYLHVFTFNTFKITCKGVPVLTEQCFLSSWSQIRIFFRRYDNFLMIIKIKPQFYSILFKKSTVRASFYWYLARILILNCSICKYFKIIFVIRSLILKSLINAVAWAFL